ncbi:3'-phosphoadenosine 5'-phosphosulfate sulfotransferase (PAPS reductase)/FAD synthetase [Roseateles asaccharophilus]|uniref:phosphoadenosine phosphosulfate reductase domain-containing protein n=1 Tax=Roseateles asaccharophilus TaxID=582607 RepID=UPI0038362D5A
MQAATINIEPRREKLCLPKPNLLSQALRKLAITPEVQGLLDRNAVVAIGVSGGKDSQAVAAATIRFLDSIGHTGPRVLVHSDLGRVEWEDSLPACQRLAAKLGVELLVVRRQAGDMLARWQGRWAANLERYIDLSCVKVILPWSTPSMRFCTSELKHAVICSELRKRYPDQEILNVTGIRREESAQRAKAPISSVDKKLTRKGVIGMAWNAIIEWTLEEALQEIADAGLELHEAYTVYGVSRVSCAFCIMSAYADLIASAGAEQNHKLYVQMVELEADSGFGFQGNRWLADVAPHLISEELRARVEKAKLGAASRKQIESLIPKHLEYVKGWPTVMPTDEEAELIARVRREVAAVLGIEVKCTTVADVIARYAELMAIGAAKAAAKAAKAAKKGAKKGAVPDHLDEDDVEEGEEDEALA